MENAAGETGSSSLGEGVRVEDAIEATPPTAPSLLSLPDELLIKVTLLLDVPAALALAGVHSRLTPIADHLIWRDLPLTPYGRNTRMWRGTKDGWEETGVDEAEELWRKMVSVVGTAQKRASLVRSVSFVPMPDVVGRVVELLRLSSQNLQRLTINILSTFRRPHVCDTIDHHLYHADFNLPNLHYLHIECGTMRLPNSVPHLMHLAPNLQSLDVSFRSEELKDEDTRHIPNFPLPRPHLSIRNLHYSYMPSLDGAGGYEAGDTRLVLFPNVERLSLTVVRMQRSATDPIPYVRADLNHLEHIRELCWNYPLVTFQELVGGKNTALCGLRRLAISWQPPSYRMWLHEALDDFLELPYLEALYMTLGFPIDMIAMPNPYGWQGSISEAMPLPFASSLRRNPNLRIIHHFYAPPIHSLEMFDQLDELELSGELNGTVLSIRHGQDELLHLRFFRQAEYTWVDQTDFRGKQVPMEIIERVRVEEGISEAEWKGRGIEVGDKAWAVLEEWYEGLEGVRKCTTLFISSNLAIANHDSVPPYDHMYIYLQPPFSSKPRSSPLLVRWAPISD